LLHSCSYELVDIVARLLHVSFSTGKIHTYWLIAIVTPVLKATKPTGLSDFRLISVTPHLSRLVKKVDSVGCVYSVSLVGN